MKKEIEVAAKEQYEYLLEEIKAIEVNAKNILQIEVLRWKFQLGEAVANSRLYLKSAKGSGELIRRLENDLGYRKTLLYSAVAAYEHYSAKLELKSGQEIADKVWKEHRNWTTALREAKLLPSVLSRDAETTCPQHDEFHLVLECVHCRKSERVKWGKVAAKSRQKISQLLNKKLI